MLDCNFGLSKSLSYDPKYSCHKTFQQNLQAAD